MESPKKNRKKGRPVLTFLPLSIILERGTASDSSGNQIKRPGGEDDWLLRKLPEEASPSSTSPSSQISTLDTRPYEGDERMYKMILDRNMVKLNISIPGPKAIYQTPIWYKGEWICLADGNVERTLESYIMDIYMQFYQDKAFFRCLATSFWGPMVASVFVATTFQRPFIQISFRGISAQEFATKQEEYAKKVEMFAYMMGRLRLMEGGTVPITKIFGFKFVDSEGLTISSFETRERLMRDDTYDASDKLIILHRWLQDEGIAINVGDE
ncbi:hypothetical protein Hte_006465 [Hypoxylon texense]